MHPFRVDIIQNLIILKTNSSTRLRGLDDARKLLAIDPFSSSETLASALIFTHRAKGTCLP